MSELEHFVQFHPAYDKRPKYGVHGVELRMVVKGPRGAVQFLLATNWYLLHVQKQLDTQYTDHLSCHPFPADLGYHSLVPHYEGQPSSDECPWVEGGTCYYDGSGLRAEPVYECLLREGDAGVWAMLEDEYHALFDDNALESTVHETSGV